MLRRFRFGFLSLFAAMLLLVSAAGWWKFHHELYVEEVDALKRMRAPGVRIDLKRAESGWVAAPEDDQTIPWNAALIGPLENVWLYGESTPEHSEIALSLPRLKAHGRLLSPNLSPAELQDVRHRKVMPYDVATLIGRALPVVEEPTLDFARLDEPIPTGVPVDEHEAERIAGAILVAWRDPTARPSGYLTYSLGDDGNKSQITSKDFRQLIVWNGESALRHHAHADPTYVEGLTLLNGNVWLKYSRRGDRWLPESRYVGHDSAFSPREGLRFPDDEFPYRGLGDHNWNLVRRTFDAMGRLELERVERIDDVRYRIDFAPFEAVPKPGDKHGFPATVAAWRCVLRSDLDWAPEEVLIVENSARYPLERRLVQRFARREGFVLLKERLIQDRQGQGYPQRSRIRYATEPVARVADRAFDPASLGGEVWPAPPSLPIWRWYRVTFAMSVALFAFALWRNLVERIRRQRSSNESGSGTENGGEESAVAPTPGA